MTNKQGDNDDDDGIHPVVARLARIPAGWNFISCCHIVPESESKSSTAMPRLDLYYNIISPPCRVVLLFAKWLKLELNLIELDVLKRDHYKPEFIKVDD